MLGSKLIHASKIAKYVGHSLRLSREIREEKYTTVLNDLR